MKIMILNAAFLARSIKQMKRFIGATTALFISFPLYAANNLQALHDHQELDAALVAPYASERANEARTFTLKFSYPSGASMQVARWLVQLHAPGGAVVQEWRGMTPLVNGQADVALDWSGRVGKNAQLADGIYRIHMSAFSVDGSVNKRLAADVSSIEGLAKTTDADVIDQVWDIRVGNPPTAIMPEFSALETNAVNANSALEKSAGATASLPYTVYYGNLHSQTNHSDGGGNVASCSSSQAAQTGEFGPADAFPYAKNAGLDFLMTSEHNHYFDGSSGTNASASPTAVKNLYQSGLTAATNFNAANAGFLAIYGRNGA
jgi:hypothetical protein